MLIVMSSLLISDSLQASIPPLPPSCRGVFGALPPVQRGIVRKYLTDCWQYVYRWKDTPSPSSAPLSLYFVLPSVVSELGITPRLLNVLSAVWFVGGGNKRGLLSSEVLIFEGITGRGLQEAKKRGLIYRTNRDHLNPLPSADRRPWHSFIWLTPEGIDVLARFDHLFRAAFFDVVTRHGFEPQPLAQKKPGTMAGR